MIFYIQCNFAPLSSTITPEHRSWEEIQKHMKFWFGLGFGSTLVEFAYTSYLIYEKTRQTYCTLLFSNFHGMFHFRRLQHDGIIRLALLLHKLLFIVCLLRAKRVTCDFLMSRRGKFYWNLERSSLELLRLIKCTLLRLKMYSPQLVCHNSHFRLQDLAIWR